MRNMLGLAVMAGLLCFAADAGWGQQIIGRESSRDSGRSSSRGNARGQATTTNFNYNDISQRKTRQTEREDRQKKEAEAAKKKAEEDKRNKERAERMKKWEEDRAKRNGTSSASTSSGSRSTSGTRTASSPRGGGEKGKNSTAPKTVGGSYDPTTREVTEVMLDAIKTQQVKFDPEEAAKNPGIILLNPPQVDPKERKRAADNGIAQPL